MVMQNWKPKSWWEFAAQTIATPVWAGVKAWETRNQSGQAWKTLTGQKPVRQTPVEDTGLNQEVKRLMVLLGLSYSAMTEFVAQYAADIENPTVSELQAMMSELSKMYSWEQGVEQEQDVARGWQDWAERQNRLANQQAAQAAQEKSLVSTGMYNAYDVSQQIRKQQATNWAEALTQNRLQQEERTKQLLTENKQVGILKSLFRPIESPIPSLYENLGRTEGEISTRRTYSPGGIQTSPTGEREWRGVAGTYTGMEDIQEEPPTPAPLGWAGMKGTPAYNTFSSMIANEFPELQDEAIAQGKNLPEWVASSPNLQLYVMQERRRRAIPRTTRIPNWAIARR